MRRRKYKNTKTFKTASETKIKHHANQEYSKYTQRKRVFQTLLKTVVTDSRSDQVSAELKREKEFEVKIINTIWHKYIIQLHEM